MPFGCKRTAYGGFEVVLDAIASQVPDRGFKGTRVPLDLVEHFIRFFVLAKSPGI